MASVLRIWKLIKWKLRRKRAKRFNERMEELGRLLKQREKEEKKLPKEPTVWDFPEV